MIPVVAGKGPLGQGSFEFLEISSLVSDSRIFITLIT
jgi:hypothetical protein